MAMSVGAAGDDTGPMGEINTTPLIDVMLVLLIMFILTVPIQTHGVNVDLPRPAPLTLPPQPPLKNEVTIDPRDHVYLNGRKIDLPTLRAYLVRGQQMAEPPELHVQPDPQARYEMVDKVLAVAKRAQVTRMGFVGNERYANF
jgi:biopolymer transport protein ExbD